IGDPLFGDLRRLGALVDARYALLPVSAEFVPGPDGTGRVELAAAIIDTLGGRVLWYGVVAGAPGSRSEPAVLASAARRLASAVGRQGANENRGRLRWQRAAERAGRAGDAGRAHGRRGRHPARGRAAR